MQQCTALKSHSSYFRNCPNDHGGAPKPARRASCLLCTSCIICSCWCIHTLASNGWTCMLTQLRVSHHSGTAHDCLHPQNNRGETELGIRCTTLRAQKSRILPGSTAGPHRQLQCGSVCHLR